MRIGKPQSKRTPVRLRHKIEKASAAKQRKNRKEAKKNPQWRSRLKKDPGIPNLFPYKAKILAEMEEAKRRKEEEQRERREIAKAQRQGGRADATLPSTTLDSDGGLLDVQAQDEDDMDIEDDANPMAAFLASAQARAQRHLEDDDDESSSSDDDDSPANKETSKNEPASNESSTADRKVLPKRALEDPIKTVSALVERMQKTPNGFQTLLDFYQIPPLVTGNSDVTSRFLVEVARKRGRLGKGGIPNLHSAGLIVLNDLNDERLQLPSVETTLTSKRSKGVRTNGIEVVSTLAKPFRIEGLFGGDSAEANAQLEKEMLMDR